MSAVIRSRGRIVVLPFLVVHGNSHLWRIAKIEAVGAAVVFTPPVVLRIENVRVVVEAFPIRVRGTRAPRSSKSSFLARRRPRRRQGSNGHKRQRENCSSNHPLIPLIPF